jgi:hypothetical protein
MQVPPQLNPPGEPLTLPVPLPAKDVVRAYVISVNVAVTD